MADFLGFPLKIPGIAADLSVQLQGPNLEPIGTPLAVTETAQGGYYKAQMTGAAGVYSAVLLRDGEIEASIPVFRWDGTDIEPGFTSADRATLTAADAAARALADGQFVIDYADSTATQMNADGTPRTVFDLLDAEGNPATSAATSVERVPQ